MKIKTSELKDQALDWAVAKCEGRKMHFDSSGGGPWFSDAPGKLQLTTDYGSWEICGPIIEREKIDLLTCDGGDYWQAHIYDAAERVEQFGPTPLVAAMRAFVASRLGDEIDIPDELL